MKVSPAYIWGILLLMPLRGLYGYVSALTRPVTYRSETEGAAMPLRGLYEYVSALTRPVTYHSKTEGAAMPLRGLYGFIGTLTAR